MYDSAYQELLDIKQDFGDNVEMQAHFCLLMTQTTLLTDHPLTSDSLINIAISYYEKNANEKKLSDAYYYKANYLLQQKDYALAIIYARKLMNWPIKAMTMRCNTKLQALFLILIA